MRHIQKYCLGILFTFLFWFSSNAQEGSRISSLDLPNLPVEKGLSGFLSGEHNGALIIVGGTNFPEDPVTEGGDKKFYSEILVLRKIDNDFVWQSGFNYPEEIAYGAAVTIDDGLLCIGGANEETGYAGVNLVSWTGSGIEVTEWPSLPYPLSNMAASRIGNMVYVAGGLAGGQYANKFLTLDLAKREGSDFVWNEGPEFPGEPRINPVAATQNTQYEKHFFIFGGSSFLKNSEKPLVHADGLEYNPITREWIQVNEVVVNGKVYSMHGAAGIPIGAHHILFYGGVNKERFSYGLKIERELEAARLIGDSLHFKSVKNKLLDYLSKGPGWYQFNKELVLYHTISGVWTSLGNHEYEAVVDGGMVKWGDDWVTIGGEIKPGVRSGSVVLWQSLYEPAFGLTNWVVLLVYLLGMLGLGFYFMKKEESTEDFFKGGGRIPWWAAGMSIFATMLSAITFMAVPAFTYASDWKRYMMAVTIFIMAYPVIRYYLPFFRRLNVTTAYEYLEYRFNYATRLTASSIFIIFMVTRMAVVLFLPSLALTTVTGIDIYTCIILMGVITIIYCTMGGVEAVIWGDVIQGFVLLGGALLSIAFLINGTEGGLGTIMDIAIEHDKLKTFDFAFDLTGATFWVVVLGGLANNLITYSSDQAIIQRYMTTSSEQAAGKSIIFNGIMSITVSLVFYFIGTAMFGYYKTNPELLNFTMERTDSIFPYFIMTQLPVGIVGLLIAAIFAATMSTVSTNINSLSTSFTVDIFKKLAKSSSDRKQLWVARLSGILLGSVGIGIALLMATQDIQSLYDYFQYVLGLLSSGLAGLFMAGIFFPRIQTKSALLGFIGGTAVLFWFSTSTNVSGFMYGFIGMFSTVIIAYLISLFLNEKRKNMEGLTVQSMDLKLKNKD